MIGKAAGSFGARNGEPWRRGAAADRRRAEAAKSEVLGAGVAYATIAPSIEALRDAITAECCPFCSAGPFKSLGQHTNSAHGVSAQELRDMAGVGRVCSEEHSSASRARLLSREDYTELQAKAAAASAASGGYLVANAAANEPRRAIMAQRDPEICRRAKAGEALDSIAQDFGVSRECVRRALNRHGVTPTLEQTNAERRTRLKQYREAARASSDANQAAEKERRIQRYQELGADWEATHSLAAELAMSHKSLLAYLRKAGVDLPDGRVATKRRMTERPRGIPNRVARAATDAQVARIRELRNRGLSQRAIAADTGIGQSTVSRILSGRYVGP